MYPKLVALATDGTIWNGDLDQTVWGKGPNASLKIADNVEPIDQFTLQDRSNHANKITMNKDIPRIVTDILRNGASLEIVSRNTSKALSDRALYYFKAENPKTGEMTSIIKMVRHDEVVNEPKTEHFKRIHGWSKYNYNDMILFDDNPTNNEVETLGVRVKNCPPEEGLSWETYSAGIESWRSAEQTPGLTTLSIAHFNDVYQVSEQKISVNHQPETIDVTKFATSLDAITGKWATRSDGEKDGLTIFSGDLFSPSIESSVTRGRHMPPIINALGVDVSVAGNHEFDNGYPQLKKLINFTAFPWLLSNIKDQQTGEVPDPMKEAHFLERAGVRIGFIGLVEQEWIATITGWPENFVWQDMAEVGRELSAKLRDPNGKYKCDLVIALTHSRIPNDIKLARALCALSPDAQKTKDIALEQGVDLLLGGHDHIYWISKGAGRWDGYDLRTPQRDATDDRGDVLIVKSGTDFQDLSEVILTLKDTPAGSVRRKIIQNIQGKRWITRGDMAVHANMKTIVDQELKTINAAMKEPILIAEVQLDVRSSYVRLQESPIANWIADCLRHAYDEALVKLGYPKADGVIACTGDFRGDRVYEPGTLTLGDLMKILPYLDPTVVVELSANELWNALESGLSRWPTQEGRFPAISGFRVSWDSRKPAGSRIIEICLLAESNKIGADGKPILVDKEQVLRTGTRKYLIMTGEYMVQGGDGYDILKGKNLPITAENGQSKSAQFMNKELKEKPGARSALQSKTLQVLGGVESHLMQLPALPGALNPPAALRSLPLFGAPTSIISNTENIVQSSAMTFDGAVIPAARFLTSQLLFSAALMVAEHEDMGFLDGYERERARAAARSRHRGGAPGDSSFMSMNRSLFIASEKDATAGTDPEETKVNAAAEDAKKSLPAIHPVVDGRLKDVAKA